MQGQQRLESKGQRLQRSFRKEGRKMSEANIITVHRVKKDGDQKATTGKDSWEVSSGFSEHSFNDMQEEEAR